MVSLVAIIIWHIPLPIVLLGFLVFGLLDGLYLSSALTKVPDGAWFTLALAVLLCSVFILWRYGKENQWRAEAADRLSTSHLFAKKDHGRCFQEPIFSKFLRPCTSNFQTELAMQKKSFRAECPLEGRKLIMNLGTSSSGDGSSLTSSIPSPQPFRLAPALGGALISPIKGLGVFFDKTGDPVATPVVFIQFLQKFQAAPAVAVFFHIRPISKPTVNPEDRFMVSRSFSDFNTEPLVQDFFRITLRHGYTDEVVTPDIGMVLYEELRKFIIRENVVTKDTSSQDETSSGDQAETGNISSDTEPTIQTKARQRRAKINSVQQRLDRVEAAYKDQVTYVVGKEQMRIREVSNVKGWARRVALAVFLWLRGNTGSKVANLNVDVDKLVEIGFVKVV